MHDVDRLCRQIEQQRKRAEKAERERRSMLSETVFVGALGLYFVLPVIAGAYIGRWLDAQLAGYSMRWTISLILLGIVVGGYSVYRNIRD